MPRAKWGTKQKSRDWEAQEQIAVVEWAEIMPCPGHPGKIADYLFAVPNGGYYLKPGMAMKMKRMGTKAGVPDLILAVPTTKYHGLFIEMKRRKQDYGPPSRVKSSMAQSQIEFIDLMLSMGYFASFAFGATEAIEIIQGYLENE